MLNQFILTPFFLDEAIPELESLAKSNWDINKPVLPRGDKQQRMSTIHKQLSHIVVNAFHQGKRPICIAGDCCTTIGVLAGLQRLGMNPILLWFDAHGDFNTWETTPSGFLGGMPLAMLVGRGEQSMVNAVGLEPLSEEHVILTDARDLDPEEQTMVEMSALLHFKDPKSIFHHPLSNTPIYVHIDTDIVNPHEVPAVNYPAYGGPSIKELKEVFHFLVQTGQITAISMSTWNPKLDEDGRSQEICMELLYTLCGE